MIFIKKIHNFFKLNINYEGRNFGLDLMRAIAIFVVLIHHGDMLKVADTNFPWIKLINGVDLFFVLSGFLIGTKLLKVLEKNSSFGFKSIKDFWLNRWFRTLPNYYLILFLNVIFVYFGFIKENFSVFNWKYFFFLQYFYKPTVGFFWESWSLSIQEWFYFLFPILLAIFFFIFIKLKISKRYIFLFSSLFFIVIPLALKFFIASQFDVDSFWIRERIFKVVIFRLDSLAMGLVAAHVKYWYPKVWTKCRNITLVAGIVICYVMMYTSWAPTSFYTKVFETLLYSLGCVLLLPKFDSIKSAPKAITKVVTHLSFISYAMYLTNLALVSEVIRDQVTIETKNGAWLWYVAYWFITILVSTIIYKYYEKPMRDFLEMNTYKKRSSRNFFCSFL